jgi:hypothetical protein
MSDNPYQNEMQDKRIGNLEKAVAEIKDNHLPHIAAKIVEIGTDVGWLKRFFWIVAAASIGGLIAAILNLLFTVKQ